MSIPLRIEERRSTMRIPVDSVLLYRAVGMDKFKPCNALTVSSQALEIVSEQSIPMETIVAIAVKAEGSPKYYRVYGTVTKRKQRDGGWMHIVMASSKRPWSPMFLFDVMCSTLEPARYEVAYKAPSRKRAYAELECVGDNLEAWDATVRSSQTHQPEHIQAAA